MKNSASDTNGIPAPIAGDVEDQPPEQFAHHGGGKMGSRQDGDDSSGTGGGTTPPNVENLATDDNEKVDYVPSPIPQVREVDLPKSYFAHKLACITCTLIAIVAVIGGVCGSGHCSGGGGGSSSRSEITMPVTSAPTSYRSTLLAEFEGKILEALGDDYFDEENELVQVRRTALNWILEEDPMQLESDANNLLQRYILSVFYFQTSQKSPWIECGAGGRDRCYYKLFAHISTVPGNSWLSDNHECFWATITCQNRTVEQIHMFDNGLHGSIPTELVLLSNLKGLYLTGNNFTGTIPTEFSNLSSLERLNLAQNQLVGEIDFKIFKPLPNFYSLRLHENSFTGSISSDIQYFQGRQLTLNMNDLSGSFPSEIYGLSNLNWWFAHDNQITGTISTEVSRMMNLTIIHLHNTLMSGTLPSEIGLLANLSEFKVSNTKLEGSLPEELFTGLSMLDHIILDNCAFSGTISTSIGLQTSLNTINLANNAFVGTIPDDAFERNTGLRDFFVNGNQFTGTFPESVCTNSFASKSEISDIVADCLPDEDTKIVAMECECCTECCSPNTKICLYA